MYGRSVVGRSGNSQELPLFKVVPTVRFEARGAAGADQMRPIVLKPMARDSEKKKQLRAFRDE